MARTTEEIRTERQRLDIKVDEMKNDLQKSLADGPYQEIRELMEECKGLGHPNIAPSNAGGFLRKVCPDCGYYEYI